jgi:hypothetical protein
MLFSQLLPGAKAGMRVSLIENMAPTVKHIGSIALAILENCVLAQGKIG